jgi:hypothetical protein
MEHFLELSAFGSSVEGYRPEAWRHTPGAAARQSRPLTLSYRSCGSMARTSRAGALQCLKSPLHDVGGPARPSRFTREGSLVRSQPRPFTGSRFRSGFRPRAVLCADDTVGSVVTAWSLLEPGGSPVSVYVWVSRIRSRSGTKLIPARDDACCASGFVAGRCHGRCHAGRCHAAW